MANAFTATRAWRYGGAHNRELLRVEGTLVIDTTASGGAAAGDFPASMFGLKEVIGIAVITNDDDSKVFFGAPAYAGTSLLVGGGALSVPQDLPNDTYKAVVQGFY